MKALDVNLRKLGPSSDIILNIKVTREFKTRVAIARWLFLAGAFVLGARAKINFDCIPKDGDE